MNDASTRLDYLRHGLPEGGSRYRRHRIDDPLSGTGWAQMRATVAELGGWDRIVSSPLARCADFAHWLGAERGLPVSIENDLREVGFGDWEGHTRAQLLAECADEYPAFYADPVHDRPAGAEPPGGLRSAGRSGVRAAGTRSPGAAPAGGGPRRGDPRHPGTRTAGAAGGLVPRRSGQRRAQPLRIRPPRLAPDQP